MNCAYHRDQPVQGVCSTCGRPICEHCLVDLSGQVHCKACLQARMAKPARDVNGFARFVLSIAPGVGHLYMGLIQRGLQFLVGGIGLAILVGMLFPPFLGLYIPALIFFSIFDAREAHLRMEQGLEVEDKGFVDVQNFKPNWNPKYVGYGLIALGAIALWNTVLNDILKLLFWNTRLLFEITNAVRGSTMGVLAIAAGIWMLRTQTRKEN